MQREEFITNYTNKRFAILERNTHSAQHMSSQRVLCQIFIKNSSLVHGKKRAEEKKRGNNRREGRVGKNVAMVMHHCVSCKHDDYF